MGRPVVLVRVRTLVSPSPVIDKLPLSRVNLVAPSFTRNVILLLLNVWVRVPHLLTRALACLTLHRKECYVREPPPILAVLTPPRPVQSVLSPQLYPLVKLTRAAHRLAGICALLRPPNPLLSLETASLNVVVPALNVATVSLPLASVPRKAGFKDRTPAPSDPTVSRSLESLVPKFRVLTLALMTTELLVRLVTALFLPTS